MTCPHPKNAHEHYRGGTECSLCECPEFRGCGAGIRYAIVRVDSDRDPFTALADTIAVRVSDQGAELDYVADGIGSATAHLRPGDRIEVSGYVRSGS